MDLESITIQNFRSIDSVALENCGRFNVLIGKNNSGKSNLLFAINAFFGSLRKGDIINLDPPIGASIDHYKHKTESPIQITSVFRLSVTEWASLASRIMAAAPNMQNAVRDLGPSFRLSVTLKVRLDEAPFAFVHRVSLVRDGGTNGENARNLLKVSDAAAAELRRNAMSVRGIENDFTAHTRLDSEIDEDDWRRLRGALSSRSAEGETRSRLPYSFRRMIGSDLTDGARSNLEQMITEEASYSDYKQAIRSHLSAQAREIEAMRQRGLTEKVETFSGRGATIPPYVLDLIEALAATKVHYLKDRRSPIGRDEANHLLSLKVRRGGGKSLHYIQHKVESLLGVRIDAFEGGPAGGGVTDAELDVDDFLVEVNGSGIREALRLVLDVEFKHPKIVLERV